MQMSRFKGSRNVRGTPTSIFKHGAMKEFVIRRFPAILCTNHQIYDEASYFFFSMLEIHLSPACVLSMALNSTRIADTPGSKLIPNGVVTPDTLASFKKITFDIDFSLQVGWLMGTLEGELSRRTPNDDISLHNHTMPRLFVDENLTVHPDDAAMLVAFYRRSSLVHHFVNLVSKSPGITRLVITLHASVFADYDKDSDSYSDLDSESWDRDSDFDSDLDSENYDIDSDSDNNLDSENYDIDSDSDSDAVETESMSRHNLMTAVANERATELILDSGLLAPLEKLSNVQSFQFEFKTQDRNGELYKPTAKHLGLLMDLKRKIERNYSIRTG